MAYVITDACICVKDATCVGTCPVDCIIGRPGDPMFFIDPGLCIDCAACMPVCPVNAIFHENDVPARSAEYIDLNRAYFSDPEATAQRVRTLHEAQLAKEAAAE